MSGCDLELWYRIFQSQPERRGVHLSFFFTLVTYAAALLKVCFYLILKIFLLIEKLSHKLGKCSVMSLTKIDFSPTIGHHWQVRVSYSAANSTYSLKVNVISILQATRKMSTQKDNTILIFVIWHSSIFYSRKWPNIF